MLAYVLIAALFLIVSVLTGLVLALAIRLGKLEGVLELQLLALERKLQAEQRQPVPHRDR
jgi:hypothetical protein